MNIVTEHGEDRYWRAYDMETYDGALDGNNTYGLGQTERESVEDLLEQIDE